jgi:hypothetical protein
MSIAYKAGDKIGFSGYAFESAAINIGTYGCPNCGSWWPGFLSGLSHVAYIAEHDSQLWLIESTTDDDCSLPCAITGKRINGVQAHPIDARINSYLGKVWHYPLVTPMYEHQIKRSTEFTLANLGKSYDAKSAVRSGMAGWTFTTSLVARYFTSASFETFFCSRLCVSHDTVTGIFSTDDESLWSPNRYIRCERRMGLLRVPIRKV